MTDVENKAVTNFRNYVKVKSVHPNPDYEGCVKWIREQADELKLEFQRVEFPKPAEFCVVLTWRGTRQDLKSIMLNSHMDVVPVDIIVLSQNEFLVEVSKAKENNSRILWHTKWTHDPFGAEKDSNGNIYGRGTQDMKSVAVQYLEAIRNLKKAEFVPKRNIHVTFVTDEELGGHKGMAVFVKTPEFAALNIGIELDEGGAYPIDLFQIFYGERAMWQIKITLKGNTGHGLMFVENTAAEKLQKIINRLLGLREKEKERLESSEETLTLGDVTTINLTMIEGGLQRNIVPPELSVTFDMRITPHWSQSESEKLIDDICKEVGEGVSYEFLNKSDIVPSTSVDDSSIWWTTLKSAFDEMKLNAKSFTCPGATDARFIRDIGIPAFGFSPMNNTPVLLHDNDEYLNESVFLKGIEIYENIIAKLASLEHQDTHDVSNIILCV